MADDAERGTNGERRDIGKPLLAERRWMERGVSGMERPPMDRRRMRSTPPVPGPPKDFRRIAALSRSAPSSFTGRSFRPDVLVMDREVDLVFAGVFSPLTETGWPCAA